MRYPLLCTDCEKRFSRNGEAYLLARLKNGTAFPLLDRLKLALPAYNSPRVVAFRADVVGLDSEKIAHFGLSLLWRAAVHNWATLDGQTTSVVFDATYQEEIRQYLLGQSTFPKDVVVVATVATDFGSQNSCFVPNRIKDNPIIAYGLMTKGLYYRIFLGVDLPIEFRKICCCSSPWKLLFVRNCEDNLMEGYTKLFETSVAVENLVSKS